MKKTLAVLLATMMFLLMAAGCGEKKQEEQAAQEDQPEVQEAWSPANTIYWNCSTSAGSAGDNFTRKTQGVIETLGLVDKKILVDNITDGSGAVAQREVLDMKGEDADYTLLSFNLGDIPTMLQNTEMKISQFRVVAAMAQDRKFLYVSQAAPFDTFEGLVEYLKENDVILGGGKADDNVMYWLLKRHIDANDHLSYLQTGDTAGTLTAVLGEQVYLGIGKLSVLKDYLESGELKAIVIEGDERAEGVLADIPTFQELGYDGIDFIQTRCVIASPAMSDEAYQYYCNVFETVANSDEFQKEYVDVYQAAVVGLVGEDAQAYLENAEETVIEAELVV